MKKYYCIIGLFITISILNGCVDSKSDDKSVVSNESKMDATEEIYELRQGVYSLELKQFLEHTDEIHQTIVKPEIDYERYLYLGNPSLNRKIIKDINLDGSLTLEQVENDIDYLIYNLQSHYGMYAFFGGDDVFLSAKEDILKECASVSILTSDFVEQCLLKHLYFIEDGHFKINDNYISKTSIPLIYKDVAFQKTDKGYETIEEHREVQSIKNYDNLDDILKQSLDADGKLVYYPIIFQDVYYSELLQGKIVNGVDLQVNFKDGTTKILNAEFYQYFAYEDVFAKQVSFHRTKGIPVIVNGADMGFDESSADNSGKKFLSYFDMVKEDPVVIVDLRYTLGGNEVLPYKWFEAFTSQKVSTNYYCILRQRLEEAVSSPMINTYNSYDTLINMLGRRDIEVGGYSISHTTPDVFVDNEKLLIILTSKALASAGETFIDMAHNVRNVLIIGENTAGAFRGRMGVEIRLPDSGIKVKYGTFVNILPEDHTYFQEFYGFEPDIWTGAGDAEELAVKFIYENYK